jgi:hypothetical protein
MGAYTHMFVCQCTQEYRCTCDGTGLRKREVSPDDNKNFLEKNEEENRQT